MEEGIGKTILVVDDIDDNIRLIRKVLGRRGYDVVAARSGEEAISVAQAERPDLILMDVRLPGELDGLEATMRIKALPHLAHIPILAVTASVKPEDEQRALDIGCSAFIRKPINISELPKQVAGYIAQASSMD